MKWSSALLLLAAACRIGKSPPPAEPAALPPSVRYDQHIFAGGIAPPSGALRNPVAGQAGSAAEGEKLFSTMDCDGCHGGGATGWVAPSLNDGRWRYGESEAAIYLSIYYGRPKGMPAFGGLLAPDLIWKLVSYLRSLPVNQAVPTQTW
jgi:cytochrome c oxidase cbb3-type subunit III